MVQNSPTGAQDTKLCPKCQTEIPKKATKCPNCRSKIGISLAGKIIAGFVVFMVAIALSTSLTSEEVPETPGIETTPGWADSKAGKICAEHSEWTPEECDKVSRERLWIGMDYDMLVYNFGKPDVANPSNYGSGIRYQYCWRDLTPSCFYDNDNDGKIDSFN